jgi:hypothetical protein
MNEPNTTTNAFQEVFLTVVLLTLLSGGASVYLSSQQALSTQQQHLCISLMTTFQMGFKSMIELLGRKPNDPFRLKSKADEDEAKK